MSPLAHLLVQIWAWLLLIKYSGQDIQTGVDLVTKLSNELIQPIFKGLAVQNENIIAGPFGLSSNLAMILEASDGKTRQEILRVLDISGKDMDDLRNGFKAYCDLFLEHSSHSEPSGSFNSVVVQSSIQLLPEFKALLSKYYCANITEVEDGKKDVAALELISDAGVMSHWRDYEKLAVYTFLSHQPLIPFTRRNNATVHVPMIPQVGIFKTRHWEGSQVILLPLQAKLVHLMLIIPDKIEDTDKVMGKLMTLTLPYLVESLTKEELEIFLPQFTAVSKNLNLSPVFTRKGVRLIFDSGKSDLSRAWNVTGKMFVKDIHQDSYFSTSFVALNSVSGVSSSVGLKRRTKRDAKKVYVDRPFFFFVLHKDTQLVLLAGKIEKPVQVPN